MRMIASLTACTAVLVCCGIVSAAEKLEQIISRENVLFQCKSSSLTIGRDGKVYLCTGGNNSFVLRMTRDGKDKYGAKTVYAAHNATANADGVAATANAHFAHKVTLYDRTLKETAALADFLVSDTVGWNAPAHVEAGASGDFYGADQHRDRIVRISPKGKLLASYTIPRDAGAKRANWGNFRVCEKTTTFHVLAGNEIRCYGFDGKLRWSKGFSLAGQWYLTDRAFDVDADGVLYVLESRSDELKRFSIQGEALPALTLQIGGDRPGPREIWFHALRVHGGDLLIRRASETELFQRYDLKTGRRQQIVTIDHERLTVTFPSLVWTAGQAVPFEIGFDAGGRATKPRWRVWARPYEAVEYRELPWKDGHLQVPADGEGLWLVKVTPEVQPWQRKAAPEYIVRAFVEVRRLDAKGSVTVLTQDGRVFFGRGEAIPFSVVVRTPEKQDVPVTVALTDGKRTLATAAITVKAGEKPTQWVLPPAATAGLAPGNYLLAVNSPEMTCVPQRLRIGPGVADTPFFRVQYFDYGGGYSLPSVWDAPDVVAAAAQRRRRLGMDLAVDRIGCHLNVGHVAWAGQQRATIEQLKKRLAADPLAVAPQKAETASPLLQLMAGYGAHGVREMAILMYNDAGLPLGSGFDKRTPEQFTEAITRVTKAMAPYPAFRGWSWSSNWWIFNQRGAAAAKTPEEKAAYTAARKRADQTGQWDPVLDKVSGYRLGYAVEAQAFFNKTLRQIAPDLVTAVAAPYRNVESYPPITFRNVDEVDLHIQWEQIGLPYHSPHNVDFYKRPGKRGWGHPEIWNDDGTGGQILSVLFQMLMRGADGVGCSGPIPPWTSTDDPRIAHMGTTSVFRALNGFLASYGPWLTTLQGDDRVAIVASGRMFKIDDWCRAHTGLHFARLFEAYITCLHAHRPAGFVFAEDMTPESLKKFKAVLVVDQRVQMEPKLAGALRAAKAAGVAVFHDGTCRAELVRGFRPLGISFDKLEKDPSTAGDDSAYWRFAGYAKANLPALRAALAPVVEPVADVGNDEVLLSRRRAGRGRYVFVVNSTLPKIEPGHLWRMNLALTTRVPVKTPVRLAETGGAVYEVLAMKRVAPARGVVQADLRSEPARIYAILPAAIDRVELHGPKQVAAGQRFTWRAGVLDAAGRPIDASVPVRVRLLAADGTVVDEHFAAAGAKPADGTMTAPIGAPAGRLVLEAAELLSGKAVRLPFAVEAAKLPMAIAAAGAGAGKAPARPQPAAPDARAQGTKPSGDLQPAEARFGPHVRDVVLADGGKLAVMNTMNWDHNLYAVDVETGKVRWRQRVGHYFAFSPEALQAGLAVQGFDFKSAEGYHLYLVGDDGKLERRFALYGLPKRLPHRFVPGLVQDHINSFAVPADGSWVASAGDLGLAVWGRGGKLLWSQDWWKTGRHTAVLAAPDARTLLVVEGMRVTAFEAADGAKRWQHDLAPTGEVTKIVSAGGTIALLSSFEGGRVFVLQGGKVTRALPTGGGDLGPSADGSLLAVTDGDQLKLYSLADGLQWIFSGDSPLRFPRFAPDGKRIVTTSDDGSLYVLDLDGAVRFEADCGARAVPQWLAEGDLLLGTWMGAVCRLDGQYKPKWRAVLRPAAVSMVGKLLADDGAPTTRITAWSNAERQARPITPSLLAEVPLLIEFVPSGSWGGRAHLAHRPGPFHDGVNNPPASPWVAWNFVGYFASTSPFNYLKIDTFHRQLRVTGITLFEDPDHPESWLRDAKFEYWDAAKEEWVLVGALLSNAAVHTHVFAKPVEAARFRIVMPFALVGNLRLGEIVFHGEALGNSHPDVAAKRPVAVLFDEQADVGESLGGFGRRVKFNFKDVHSGGRSLQVEPGQAVGSAFVRPFGHRIPNWDFQIAKTPQPGQYRYLRFAWKALSPKTEGVMLRLAPADHGGVALFAGKPSDVGGAKATRVADAPPMKWTVVTVDLWEKLPRPARIGGLSLGAVGGPAAFDQILLGRTEKDLDAYKPPAR